MTPFDKYKEDCKRLGFKPTMNEKQVNEAFGIKPKDDYLLLQSDGGKSKPVKPTLEVHEKKAYVPKQSRQGWSKEQIAARKAENVRRYRANKKQSA